MEMECVVNAPILGSLDSGSLAWRFLLRRSALEQTRVRSSAGKIVAAAEAVVGDSSVEGSAVEESSPGGR